MNTKPLMSGLTCSCEGKSPRIEHHHLGFVRTFGSKTFEALRAVTWLWISISSIYCSQSQSHKNDNENNTSSEVTENYRREFVSDSLSDVADLRESGDSHQKKRFHWVANENSEGHKNEKFIDNWTNEFHLILIFASWKQPIYYQGILTLWAFRDTKELIWKQEELWPF